MRRSVAVFIEATVRPLGRLAAICTPRSVLRRHLDATEAPHTYARAHATCLTTLRVMARRKGVGFGAPSRFTLC
jgi:hypothetical protein